MVSHKGAANNKRDSVRKTKGAMNKNLGSKSNKIGPIKKNKGAFKKANKSPIKKTYFGKKSNVKQQHFKRKRIVNAKKDGIVYLGNLPHGFYENEIEGFFSQFGNIRRVKVARSLKNARPRGYAFLEFTSGEVAKVVANTMNGYLMFNKILKCHVVPADQAWNHLFRHSNLTPEKCPRVKNQRKHQLKSELVRDPLKFLRGRREALQRKVEYLKNNVGIPITPKQVLQREDVTALMRAACNKRHEAKESLKELNRATNGGRAPSKKKAIRKMRKSTSLGSATPSVPVEDNDASSSDSDLKELNRATNGSGPAPSKKKAIRKMRKSTSLGSATPSVPVEDNDVSSSDSDLKELNRATNGSGPAPSKRRALRRKRKSTSLGSATPSVPVKDNDVSSSDSKSPKRKSPRISNKPGTTRTNSGRNTNKPGRANAKNKLGKNVDKKMQTSLKKKNQKDFGGKRVISTPKDKVKPQGGKKNSIKKGDLKKKILKFNKGLQN